MLTTVPGDVSNSRPYHQRGWTTWERSVSEILAVPPHFSGRFKNKNFGTKLLLDLGRLSGSKIHSTANYKEVVDICGAGAGKGPSLSPEEFATLMQDKIFTKGKADLDLVVNNYRRNFLEVLSVADNIAFSGNIAPFSNRELERLTRTLPHYESLRQMILVGIRPDDNFLKALAGCTKLEFLHFLKCGFGDDGCPALADALRCMPRLRDLCLDPPEEFSHSSIRAFLELREFPSITVPGVGGRQQPRYDQ